MKVVLTITGSQRFGTDEPEKTSLVTEGTLEREGDILLLSYEESELTGMEGTTTVFRVEPARITRSAAARWSRRWCSSWGMRTAPCMTWASVH